MVATGHGNLQPIRDWVLPIRQNNMLSLANISYSGRWGTRVRKCWKKMVLAGKRTHAITPKKNLMIVTQNIMQLYYRICALFVLKREGFKAQLLGKA